MQGPFELKLFHGKENTPVLSRYFRKCIFDQEWRGLPVDQFRFERAPSDISAIPTHLDGFTEDSQRTRRGLAENSQRIHRGLTEPTAGSQRTRRGLADDSQRTHRGPIEDSQRTHSGFTETSQRIHRGLSGFPGICRALPRRRLTCCASS